MVYTCEKCRHTFTYETLSCPACGSTKVRSAKDVEAAWYEEKKAERLKQTDYITMLEELEGR